MRDFEKLLLNEEFIKWVKNPTHESDLFWKEWLKGNPDKLDDFNYAVSLIQQIHYRKAPEDPKRFNRVLNNILQEDTNDNRTKRRKNKHFIFLGLEAWVKIAAVVSFILVFSYIARVNVPTTAGEPVINCITKENPMGRKSTIFLPDCTIVTLNAGSSITFPERFTREFRDVKLTGEAFFDVSENKLQPFRVKARGIYTVALGTSFNVKAYETDSNISVSLDEGLVKINGVQRQSGSSYFLNPGEKIVYNPELGDVEKLKFDRDLELAWKDGILVFKQTNLRDFVHTIERWYGVRVELTGDMDVECSVNGRFENEILLNVLESLQYSISGDVKYKLQDKTVKLQIKN
ncbi:MAG: FecR domain-containing protein [Cytophagales bacterium]|nr:FecR domain-containing protein [Cytophagales bacterium]